MSKWIYIALLIIFCQNLTAQNNCANLIEEATELYNGGNYDECIHRIENGLKTCSLSKRQKENAYILLVNSNIEKDSLGGIDKNFRLLLKNNPAFKISEYNGIDDFKKYYKNYYVYPKFSIGLRPHYSIPEISIDKIYKIQQNIENQNAYTTSPYFNANLIFDYRPLERIAFFADAGFFALNYSRTIKNSTWQMISNEKTSYFKLDVGNKFFFKPQNKVSFYFMGGFSTQYLLKSELSVGDTVAEIIDLYNSSFDKPKDPYGPEIFDIKSQRNPRVYSLLLGSGAIYRIGYWGIGLDIRFYYSLNTINKKSERFSAIPRLEGLMQKYSYIDNDVRMSKTDFSIVLTYSLYKVKSNKVIK